MSMYPATGGLGTFWDAFTDTRTVTPTTTTSTSILTLPMHPGPVIAPEPTLALGWRCPSCGRGVAPTEKTCDHGKPAEPTPTEPNKESHFDTWE